MQCTHTHPTCTLLKFVLQLISDAFVVACAVFTFQPIYHISVLFASPRSCEESTFRYCTEMLLLFVVALMFFFFFFNAFIAIYFFSGRGVNPGSCTNDNINTNTIISHYPLPSSPARKVVVEQWGQFLAKDASVLDICHRHSTCSLLSFLCLPHFPHPLCKRCLKNQNNLLFLN